MNYSVSVVRDKIPIPLPFWVSSLEQLFLLIEKMQLLGIFSTASKERRVLCRREQSPSSRSSSCFVQSCNVRALNLRRGGFKYILPMRVLPILIYLHHSLLKLYFLWNFFSIFAGCTCYIITFCSKHVDISVFCNLSTHFLSDKENIFMNFSQYILCV